MEGGTSQGLVQSNILVGIKKKGVEPIFNKFGGRIGFFFFKATNILLSDLPRWVSS